MQVNCIRDQRQKMKSEMMKCIKNWKISWEEMKLVAMKQICYRKQTDSKGVYKQVGKSSSSAKTSEERPRTLSSMWLNNLR